MAFNTVNTILPYAYNCRFYQGVKATFSYQLIDPNDWSFIDLTIGLLHGQLIQTIIPILSCYVNGMKSNKSHSNINDALIRMARLMSILYMYKIKFKPFKHPIDTYIPSYRIFIISKIFLDKHHLSINYDIYKVHNKVLHMMLTFKNSLSLRTNNTLFDI